MKVKRILVFIMVVLMVSLTPTAAYAAEVNQAPTEGEQPKTEAEIEAEIEAEKQAELEKKEKEDSYARPVETNGIANWPQGPAVYADSAVVMDMDSGVVLFGKNMDAQHYPASITKLLTVLVALENAELTDTVKFTEDSISFLQYDDAHIGMKPGEEINLKDALHGVLLASANEVSYAVAESVGTTRFGGNFDTFIQKMNDRATELGCTNSHWVNPNGLHDDQHYTTAHDMALIASAVYQQEEFRKIMGTLEYKIGHTNITQEERVFQQNHKMLWPENYYYYEHAKGGKTGYTDQAKTTLVTMADNGNMRLAAVVLYDYGVDAYTDTRSMLDYGFTHFSKGSIKESETSDDIKQFNGANPYVILPENVTFSQLEKNIVLTDDALKSGEITYSYGGWQVGKTEIVLSDTGYEKQAMDTKESDTKHVEAKKSENVKETPKKDNSRLKLSIAIVAGVILLIMILFIIWSYRRRRNHRRINKRNKRKR